MSFSNCYFQDLKLLTIFVIKIYLIPIISFKPVLYLAVIIHHKVNYIPTPNQIDLPGGRFVMKEISDSLYLDDVVTKLKYQLTKKFR